MTLLTKALALGDACAGCVYKELAQAMIDDGVIIPGSTPTCTRIRSDIKGTYSACCNSSSPACPALMRRAGPSPAHYLIRRLAVMPVLLLAIITLVLSCRGTPANRSHDRRERNWAIPCCRPPSATGPDKSIPSSTPLLTSLLKGYLVRRSTRQPVTKDLRTRLPALSSSRPPPS